MKDFWINNQGIIGIIIGAVATIGAALAGFLKSKGDQIDKSVSPSGKIRYYLLWFVLTVLFVAMSTFGSWLSKRSGDAAFKQALATNLQTRQEVNDLRIQLGLAIHTNSIAITEAQMRSIQDELHELASKTLGTTPEERKRYAELKANQSSEKKRMTDEARAKRLQKSSERFPSFAFVSRYFQDSINAFAAQAGKTNIHTEPVILPESLYYPADMTNAVLWSVQISPKALWQAEMNLGNRRNIWEEGFNPINNPYLVIKFDRGDGQEDLLFVQVNEDATKVYVVFQSSLPAPAPEKITGVHDLHNFESTLKPLLAEVMKAEWMDADDAP